MTIRESKIKTKRSRESISSHLWGDVHKVLDYPLYCVFRILSHKNLGRADVKTSLPYNLTFVHMIKMLPLGGGIVKWHSFLLDHS